MSHRMRPGARYTWDDGEFYPPPIGDSTRGRPRSRTVGDEGGADYYKTKSYIPAPRGYSREKAEGHGQSPYNDRYSKPPLRKSEGRRADHSYSEGESKGRHRAPHPDYPTSPPRHARTQDLRQDEYDSPLPKRTRSTGRGRRVEESAPPMRRYESPDPTPRAKYRNGYVPQARAGHLHRDDSRGSRRPRSPEEYGRDLLHQGGASVRRSRPTHSPPPRENHDAYGGGYRPQPRRRSSLDEPKLDSRYPPRRSYYGRSPSPTPHARHRSVPPKVRSSKLQQSALGNLPWQSLAKSALTAGAQAAFKARKDPSPWMGEKGARVATAALGAALVDGFVTSKHPDKAGGKRHKGLHKATANTMDKAVSHGMAKRGY